MQKTILVTGGNRGIGLETCKQLAAMGHTVIMGSRNLEKGQEKAKAIDGNVIAKQLDVTSEASINALKAEIQAEFGKLDVLINNAGIMSEDNVSDVSIEEQKRVMETNVWAPMRMVQIFVPLLNNSDDPRIVNLSSQMGQRMNQTADHSAYRLSKFTLNGLTLQLANALPNIKVNAMHPGWVKTDMGGSSAPLSVEEGADTSVWLATADNIPSGKLFCCRELMEW
ncbi:SDR family oxidoreductase [Paracrocinitomix mangrovi]|uniref:SDR family oxidoreductase n=1 Tax=Paracrocinitomix mangrovi TaxID=2862509 RepID=UPI001C8F0C61|nr:SDR family oxidoreductase [Paracrocinitomix mangrovi]UKN01185.1 SDR family oxidoreductase [Paracrocinitomix mangrovi]